VPVVIIRDGRRQSVTVTVGQRPTDEQLAQQSGAGEETPPAGGAPVPVQQALGLSLQPLTPALGTAAGLPPEARGVIITAVDPASDAAEEGLQRGDLIVSVNRQAVTTPAQVLAAVAAARRAGRTTVLLLVRRGRAPEAFVGVEIGGR
jgi:serine protease Do